MKNLFFILVMCAVSIVGAIVEPVSSFVSVAMLPAVISDDYKRYMWEVLKTKIADFDSQRIQPGVIRIEVPLTADSTNYIFPLLDENSPSASNVERRLNRSDSFIVGKHGILLGLRNDAEPSRTKLYSYASPEIAAAIGRADLVNDLQSVYNGSLNIILDQMKMIEDFDLNMFKRVPVYRQSGAGVVVTSEAVSETEITPTYEADKFQDSESPLLALDSVVPAIVYNGTAKNEISVRFAKEPGVNLAPAAGHTVMLVYYAVGYRCAGINVNL